MDQAKGSAWDIDASPEAIARRIKAARERDGRSRTKIEEVLGLPERALEGYEQGTRAVPDMVLVRLGREYGVHPAQLRYGDSVLREAAEAWFAGETEEIAVLLQDAAERAKALRERIVAGGSASVPSRLDGLTPLTAQEVAAAATNAKLASRETAKGGRGGKKTS